MDTRAHSLLLLLSFGVSMLCGSGEVSSIPSSDSSWDGLSVSGSSSPTSPPVSPSETLKEQINKIQRDRTIPLILQQVLISRLMREHEKSSAATPMAVYLPRSLGGDRDETPPVRQRLHSSSVHQTPTFNQEAMSAVGAFFRSLTPQPPPGGSHGPPRAPRQLRPPLSATPPVVVVLDGPTSHSEAITPASVSCGKPLDRKRLLEEVNRLAAAQQQEKARVEQRRRCAEQAAMAREDDASALRITVEKETMRLAAQKERMKRQLAQQTALATVHYRSEREQEAPQRIRVPIWRVIKGGQGIDPVQNVFYIARLHTGRLVPVEYDARKNAYYLPDPLPVEKALSVKEQEQQLETSDDMLELQLVEPLRASPSHAFGGGVLSTLGGLALIYALTKYVQAYKEHRHLQQTLKQFKERAAVPPPKADSALNSKELSVLVRGFYDASRRFRSIRNRKMVYALLATALGVSAVVGGVTLARTTRPLGAKKYTWIDSHHDCPGYEGTTESLDYSSDAEDAAS